MAPCRYTLYCQNYGGVTADNFDDEELELKSGNPLSAVFHGCDARRLTLKEEYSFKMFGNRY
jgi:hypothetical protein